VAEGSGKNPNGKGGRDREVTCLIRSVYTLTWNIENRSADSYFV